MLSLFEAIQLVVFLALLILLFKGMGEYIGVVLNPERRCFLDRWLRLHLQQEQTWRQYLAALLVFSAISGIATFLLLFFQSRLPLNPQGLPDVPSALAMNIAVSFLTNTDWQAYGGETTLSYFSQMAALTVQNFFSPAVGLCAAAVLFRGVSREGSSTVGNFWVDLSRILTYLLLPMAIIFGIVLIQQGTPQNFSPYLQAETLQNGAMQTIVQGPMASQEAIKVLGTNGGGFTRAGSAHPYENPSLGTNFIQAAAFFLITIGQLYYFGKKARCLKTVWIVFAAILLVFTAGVVLCTFFENGAVPSFAQANVDASWGNLEGKEIRFGVFGSCFYTMASAITSGGALDAMLSSFTPLGGMVPLVNIQLGKMIFGGVGIGICNLALFALLIVFFMMFLLGRSPRFLGKRIGMFDASMAFIAFGLYFLGILGFTGAAIGSSPFSEVFYAYSSAAANNGSAMGSLQADTPWFNCTTAAVMLLGRFGTLVPVLAFAGAMAGKKREQGEASLFPVSGGALLLLLFGSLIVLGIIVFLPGLMFGPLLKAFQLLAG